MVSVYLDINTTYCIIYKWNEEYQAQTNNKNEFTKKNYCANILSINTNTITCNCH